MPSISLQQRFRTFLRAAGTFAAGVGLLLCTACNNTKSYADMLKDERKCISRFISDNNIEVLKTYPANGVFADNQFVQLDNGVYLNVVDSGNGNRAVSGQTTILCRARVKWLMEWLGADTATVDNLGTDDGPMVFKYGVTIESTDEFTTYFCSSGLASALEYVGDSSTVKLIVPFAVSSQSFNTNGIPLYYSKVLYRFDPQ